MSVEWDVWAPTFAFIVPMLIGTVYMSVRQARWTRESRARREMTNYVDEKIRRLEQRIEAGERRLERGTAKPAIAVWKRGCRPSASGPTPGSDEPRSPGVAGVVRR